MLGVLDTRCTTFSLALSAIAMTISHRLQRIRSSSPDAPRRALSEPAGEVVRMGRQDGGRAEERAGEAGCWLRSRGRGTTAAHGEQQHPGRGT